MAEDVAEDIVEGRGHGRGRARKYGSRGQGCNKMKSTDTTSQKERRRSKYKWEVCKGSYINSNSSKAFIETPGPRKLPGMHEAIDFFFLLFMEALIMQIVEQTNVYAIQKELLHLLQLARRKF